MKTFVKHNTTPYPDILLREAQGIELLSQALAVNTHLKVPEIFHADTRTLEAEYIGSIAPDAAHSCDLGRGLAELHSIPRSYYGLDEDNYIGLNPQKNCRSDDWGSFFVDYRLGYQVSLIRDSRIRSEFAEVLGRKGESLAQYLSAHTDRPSLLHGDLWSGNVLYGRDGVYLIDPAVYHGDREVDIAMTEMFGGFGREFYRAYDEHSPLSLEYPTKRIIYNLYHYLNHYNLFGSSYLDGVRRGFEVVEGV